MSQPIRCQQITGMPLCTAVVPWLAVLALPRPAAVPVIYGLNVLDGKTYPHHPAMLQVPQHSYKVEPGVVTEFCGLKIPHHLDCPNLRNESVESSRSKFSTLLSAEFDYYRFVPSRRLQCKEHQAYIEARISHSMVSLPLFDDEYSEHVAVYQSVLRHRHGTFRMAELGARWGTWGARAVALLRSIKGFEAPYEMFFVEPMKRSCNALKKVMHLNQIRSFRLWCDLATPERFRRMMEGVEFLDLVHIDIQWAEAKLLGDPSVKDLLWSRVARIIVGTHSKGIHEKISKLYSDWIVIFNLPFGFPECIFKVLRSDDGFGPSAEDWAIVRERGCFHNTPQGPVINLDGLLVLDNPNFVDASKAFSLGDTDLRIDDLKTFEAST